ncbi:helix-turn-helix transcriptional regulator [Tengunoibacter tsumagoiensis]|uniref:Uncharacterized protein n=1 Tax=Tengunoibacter tsumagoiensis TaxID=2014871 RepID=A0A402A917_9CHLR|nr:helix-turn-helix domain-containing protein [Tengunoibacter tsumagoiensis]GCE15667.1 hypothetical protein KTT_55260 [Tengunoibacter tsumagoiensis]
MNNNQSYYTASEAQQKLGLSKAMFFRKVNQGLIPKVVLPGMKQGMYPKRDINALAMAMNMVFEQFDKIVFSRSTPADQVEEMQIGTRCFGNDFITPLPDRIAFQQKSEFTFHSLKVNGNVAGYISMFSLSEQTLDALLIGQKIEREIVVKDILPFSRFHPFSVYIDVIAVDPNLPHHVRNLYSGIILYRFMDVLMHLISNGYQITTLYTVTTTVEGDNMVRKLGFELLEGKSLAPGRLAYRFVLDETGIKKIRDLSQRARAASRKAFN